MDGGDHEFPAHPVPLAIKPLSGCHWPSSLGSRKMAKAELLCRAGSRDGFRRETKSMTQKLAERREV